MFFNNNYNYTAQAQGHPNSQFENQSHDEVDYYKHQLNA